MLVMEPLSLSWIEMVRGERVMGSHYADSAAGSEDEVWRVHNERQAWLIHFTPSRTPLGLPIIAADPRDRATSLYTNSSLEDAKGSPNSTN